MAAVRGKDTALEQKVRKPLHNRGFRYRLHDNSLPGKPDIVLRKYGAVIQVHGCFWHGHQCPLFKMPESRREFWEPKILGNVARDAEVDRQLRQSGWRVGTVWECAFKGKGRLPEHQVTDLLENWLLTDAGSIEIRGTQFSA